MSESKVKKFSLRDIKQLDDRDIMNSASILLTGRKGKGKSLGMTVLANIHKIINSNRNEKEGRVYWPVYANYDTEVADICDEDIFFKVQDFNHPLNKAYHDCTILLDEIQTYLDSSRGATALARDFGQFLIQARKRNIHLVGTTQFATEIAARALRQMDVFFTVKRVKQGRRADLLMFGYDYHRNYVNPRTAHKVDFPLSDFPPHWIRKFYNVHKFYDKYSTRQTITPSWFKQLDSSYKNKKEVNLYKQKQLQQEEVVTEEMKKARYKIFRMLYAAKDVGEVLPFSGALELDFKTAFPRHFEEYKKMDAYVELSSLGFETSWKPGGRRYIGLGTAGDEVLENEKEKFIDEYEKSEA